MRYKVCQLQSLIGTLLLVLGLAQEAGAQPTCPYEPSAAIADTLDYLPYYPLSTGNTWEYSVESGSFPEDPFQLSVIGDSLIEGSKFHRVRRVTYRYGVPIEVADTTEFFVHVSDTLIFEYASHLLSPEDIRLSADFRSCYTGYGGLVAVGGGYDQGFRVPENGRDTTYVVPGLKEFLWIGAEETFAYGVGRIRIEGDPFVVTQLVYAKIDGDEIGTPLDSLFDIRVGVDGRPMRNSTSLRVYPNPTRSRLNVEAAIDRPGAVSLDLFDILGRQVANVYSGQQASATARYSFSAGRLTSGMYILVMRGPHGLIGKKPVLLVQ